MRSTCRSRASSGTIGKTDDRGRSTALTPSSTPTPTTLSPSSSRPGLTASAVAIGTSHGIYPSWMKPELKLDLLEEIARKVSIPLVLHGGSNNPDSEIGRVGEAAASTRSTSPATSRSRITTRCARCLRDADLREPNSIQPPCVAAMKVTAAQKIDLFDAAGKAELY